MNSKVTQKIIIITCRVLSYPLMFFGLLFTAVAFVRSFQSFHGEEWLLPAYYCFSVFLSGVALGVVSYILEAVCLYINKNKEKQQ